MRSISRLTIAAVVVLVSGCSPATDAPAPSGPTINPESERVPEPESPEAAGSALESEAELVVPANAPLALTVESSEAKKIAETRRLAESDSLDKAMRAIANDTSVEARYVRAQLLRKTGKLSEAAQQLDGLDVPPALRHWIMVERAEIANAMGDDKTALSTMAEAFGHSDAIDRSLTLPLAELRARYEPGVLWQERDRHEKALDPNDPDARSRWLDILAKSVSNNPRDDASAVELQVRRYVEEPASTLTPIESPRPLSPQERVERAEALLAAHRNERVVEQLVGFADEAWSQELRCRRDFALGMGSRKLRRYRSARTYLERVVEGKCDRDLTRRAHFVWAKVISIAQGLAAIKPIEDFASRYVGHSMVDDVLFWAGDMYQRRGRRKEAEEYYRRITSMKPFGDQCAIAGWRLAWMSYRGGQLKKADAALRSLVEDAGCVEDPFDRARAFYWRGRIAESQSQRAAAVDFFASAMKVDPFGFYAQLGLARLERMDTTRFKTLTNRYAAPDEDVVPELCPGFLTSDQRFLHGLDLYRRGLSDEAAAEWLSIDLDDYEVLAPEQANVLATDAKPTPVREQPEPPAQCDETQPPVLLALLLSRAGEQAEAQWRLRARHSSALAWKPSGNSGVLWRAAYPLEARDAIGAAEQESGLPSLFLQALAREESAFDAGVVSWAGAYGLTQLLLSTGKAAGRLLTPNVTITRAEELLEPRLNARLGGALLGYLLERYDGHPALALAAYNAGESVANTWWKRHSGHDLDYFAESMTIKETRGYVKRVLRTHGIYRWLYADSAPVLPITNAIPTHEAVATQ
ncbi:MAG: transglycosylase SLT domain-containing protein [Myxococcota bacterium]